MHASGGKGFLKYLMQQLCPKTSEMSQQVLFGDFGKNSEIRNNHILFHKNNSSVNTPIVCQGNR